MREGWEVGRSGRVKGRYGEGEGWEERGEWFVHRCTGVCIVH